MREWEWVMVREWVRMREWEDEGVCEGEDEGVGVGG